MAQISDERILELQKIIKEEYGREVTVAEARSIGNTLVDYFDLLAKIYHRMKTKE